MDPFREHRAARVAVLFMLVGVPLVFGFMQKSLVTALRERGGRSSWLGTPSGSPSPLLDCERAVAELLGAGFGGAEAGDLDGDGLDELLLVRAAPLPARGQPALPADTVAGVVVLSPRSSGKVAVLFDSAWSSAANSFTPANLWRARRLGLLEVRLEGLDLGGEPVGTGLEVSWRRREQAFWQHVVRVDGNRLAQYN